MQIVLFDPHYWGECAGYKLIPTSPASCGWALDAFELAPGVSLMVMAHVAVACPNLTFACDTHYPWQTAEDEVVAAAGFRLWLRAHTG